VITFTSVQLDAWIAAFFFPLTRILAVFAIAPLVGSAGIPRRIRLLLGLAVTLALAPMLPAPPAVAPASAAGFGILIEEFLIGLGMGFAMRAVFAAVEMAGEFIGLQMGLGFATFYDPLSSGQTPVVTEFVNLLALLVFLAINGPLLYVATLAQSFSAIPVGSVLSSESWKNLASLGSVLFSGGLLLALPVLVTLIITNLAIAVLSRASPQLNVFAIGFPITLSAGLAALAASLGYLATPMQELFEHGLNLMLGFSRLR
jgi:flagellar biosynthetic protein FliR